MSRWREQDRAHSQTVCGKRADGRFLRRASSVILDAVLLALFSGVTLGVTLEAQGPARVGELAAAQGVPGRVEFPGSREDGERDAVKTLVGQVVDKEKTGLPQAVVHLKNKKTLAVRTHITDEEGRYRFVGLDRDTDYAVHAVSNGKSSRTRTVSSFDDREEIYLVLEIDTSE